MTMNRNPLVTALAAVSLATALSGCAPLVIGGAAVSAMVSSDRRTSGAQLEDEGIEMRAGGRVREALGDTVHVNITSYNRQVLLTGEVPTDQAKRTAEQIVLRVENVKGVSNELAVLPVSTIGQRSSDTFITGQIKASLVDDKELYVGAFKVVTERGVVYLMGRVTQREADRATQLARTVDGTQRVVRLFEIITDDDLRYMTPGVAGPARVPSGPQPLATSTPSVPVVTGTPQPAER